MSATTANWNYPTAVRFGAGRIERAGRGLPRRRHQAAAVRHRSRPRQAADRRERRWRSSTTPGLPAALFSDVQAEPGRVQRRQPASRPSSAGGHDGVVAFGGGSALDAGKLIAFMAGQTRPMWDFEDVGDWWTRADADGIAPIVAVPTTAGTGSEVGRAGVITNEATHTKKVIFHPKMMPAMVICDPELTVGMPPLHHRRHRHGRARPLPRGLLRAGLSSDGRRHRGRRHAAGQGEPAEGACRTATTSRRAPT